MKLVPAQVSIVATVDEIVCEGLMHDPLEIIISKQQHDQGKQGKNQHRRQRQQTEAQTDRATKTTHQSVKEAKTRRNDALPLVLINKIKTLYIFSYAE